MRAQGVRHAHPLLPHHASMLSSPACLSTARHAVGQWLFVPGAMELASLFAEHFRTCHKYSLCVLA